MTYRVREPFLAVRDEPPKRFGFVTLSPGAIITIKGEVQQSGLVDVLHDGEVVAAFMRDIQTRAELVEGRTAS